MASASNRFILAKWHFSRLIFFVLFRVLGFMRTGTANIVVQGWNALEETGRKGEAHYYLAYNLTGLLVKDKRPNVVDNSKRHFVPKRMLRHIMTPANFRITFENGNMVITLTPTKKKPRYNLFFENLKNLPFHGEFYRMVYVKCWDIPGGTISRFMLIRK